MKKNALLLTPDQELAKRLQPELVHELNLISFNNPNLALNWVSREEPCAAILVAASLNSALGLNLVRAINSRTHQGIPVFWLTPTPLSAQVQAILLAAGVSDVFEQNGVGMKKLLLRLNYQSQSKLKIAPRNIGYTIALKAPFTKRLFDIVLSLTALICLLPLLLLVALLIRLESKGPVFYYSYRVGTGYKIFKFWKFRSMRQDADALLSSMKNLNQYHKELPLAQPVQARLCDRCAAAGAGCQNRLIDAKGHSICESHFQQSVKGKSEAAFIKIANDPRITRFGSFIRNTSIDELPQLYNVLRGDMSIVGNRPLPMYEAEKITTDEFAARFIAPAGITGLWQVSKRGKGDMSEQERKMLDVSYARNFSFRMDLQIILKTFPALFQNENV